MTVSVTTPYVAYAGAGTSGPFAIPFRFLANADLVVAKINAAGVETTLTGNTITGAGDDDGGELHTAAPVAAGETLKVYRQTARAQTAQYVANGPFPAATHERALDKAMLVDQEQDRDLGRAILAPIGETVTTLPSAAERAGKVIIFDEDGNPTVTAAAAFMPVYPVIAQFLRSTTAAEARQVLAAWPTLNVLDFIPFALHAGIRAWTYTGDLSPYIQLAIDAASAVGTAVYMPAGRYFVYATLNITASFTGIVGEGRNQVYIFPGGNYGDVIYARAIGGAPNISGLVFSGFSIYSQTDTTSGASLHIEKPNILTISEVGLYARYGGLRLAGPGHCYIDLDTSSDTNFSSFRAGSYLVKIEQGATGIVPAEIHFGPGDWRGQSSNRFLDYSVLITAADGIWFEQPHWGFCKRAGLALLPESDTTTLVSVNVSKGYMDTVSDFGVLIVEPSASYTGQFGGHDIDLSYIYNVGLDGLYWDIGSPNTFWSRFGVASTSRIGRHGINLVQGSKVTITNDFHLQEIGYSTPGSYGIQTAGTFSDFNIGQGVIEKGGSPNAPAAGLILGASVDKFRVSQLRIRGCAAAITDNSGTASKFVTAALTF